MKDSSNGSYTKGNAKGGLYLSLNLLRLEWNLVACVPSLYPVQHFPRNLRPVLARADRFLRELRLFGLETWKGSFAMKR